MHSVQEAPAENVHLEKQVGRPHQEVECRAALPRFMRILRGKRCVRIELREVMIERLVGEMEKVVLQPAGRPAQIQPLMNSRPGERGCLPPEQPQDQSGIPAAMPYPLSEEVSAARNGESGKRRCAVPQRLPDLGL